MLVSLSSTILYVRSDQSNVAEWIEAECAERSVPECLRTSKSKYRYNWTCVPIAIHVHTRKAKEQYWRASQNSQQTCRPYRIARLVLVPLVMPLTKVSEFGSHRLSWACARHKLKAWNATWARTAQTDTNTRAWIKYWTCGILTVFYEISM